MTTNATLSIAIVSGKGGVGKTNIALNLAYALYRAKQRVLLMDCDLGLANLDILLGIAPATSIEQVILEDLPLTNALVTIEQNGLDLLPASSGVELGGSASIARDAFIQKVNALASGYNYLILDEGAGITDAVQNFAVGADLRVVIITPEPTSLTDAYALIKVIVTQHNIKDFYILVNQAESAAEEKMAFSRLAAACDKFLSVSVKFLGGIKHDPAMIDAVRRQQPLLKFAPASPAGKDLIAVAVKIHKLRASLELTPDMPLKLPVACEAGLSEENPSQDNKE